MPEIDLPLGDLVSVLRTRARLHPQRIAIEFLGDGERVTESVSYEALDRRARALAATLQDLCDPGERALLLFPSGPDYVVAFFACLYAGVIAVPLYPPEAGQPQAVQRLASVMKDARPGLALTDPAGIEALARQGIAEPGMRVLATTPCATAARDWREHAARPGDIAFLQYTSGSTADPKGVIVTHRHLVANKAALSSAYAETSQDRYMSWLPLFHDMGLILGLLQPLFYGLPLALMSPKHFLERPRRWLEAVARHRATISGGPDFAFRLCAERIRPETVAGLDLSSWRVAFSGAEPVRRATLDRFARFAGPLGFDARALNPCYGLAEATLFVSGHRFGQAPQLCFSADALAAGIARPAPDGVPLVACGRTAPGTDVHIVSPAGERLPDGRVGEIRVQGPTVAAGYWRNAAATRDTFHAAHDRGPGAWLRTGDLGFIHDGQLYISSRLKDLIILRGRNFYPQDIEREVETRVPGVRPGRVAAFGVESDGAEAIGVAAEAARLRPGEGTPADVVHAIRTAVAEAFGEPVAAVALLKPGALPRTSSGKLQRSACRAGWNAGTLQTLTVFRADAGRASDATPRTETEQRLAALWAKLLDLAAVHPGDNFFSLGGHSLLATQLAACIHAEFGAALPLSTCFTAPTLAEMAARIEEAPRVARRAGLQPRRAEGAEEQLLPLSFAQRRLWFLQSLEPDSVFHHVGMGLAFSGPVATGRLQAALDIVVARHEALRTAYVETDDGPRQRVMPPARVRLDRVRASDSQLQARAFLSRPFDLARGELVRGLLIENGLAPQLILAMHHIAIDGWSFKRLLSELAAAYAGQPLAPPSLQYGDYALWQQAALAARLPALEDAWRAQLHGAPALSTLRPDTERPHAQSHRGANLRFELPAGLVDAMQAWTHARQATLFMGLFTAYAVSLAEAGGQHDLVIGTDIASRHEPGSGEIVGFFVNQLPVRCRLRPGDGASTWLAHVRTTLLAAYALQDLPFDKLVEALRPVRSLSHAPVFQTKFVFQDAAPPQPCGPGLTMNPFPIERDTAELDLLFDLTRHAQGVSVRVEYATDLYRPETVTRFAARFIALLERWAADPQAPTAPPARKAIARRAARMAPMEEQR